VRIAIPLSAQQERVVLAVAERRGESIDAIVARALAQLVDRHPELLEPRPPRTAD
jgi:hypothetical protein